MGLIYDSVTFRPLSDPAAFSFVKDRRHAPFRAHWGSTIDLLERELRMLAARHVVIEMALEEKDIRLDGKPRAQARAVHPGIIISFESKWGPLRYATDEFRTFQENVRAVALSMEALRKVDRYGVSKRGEQYRGWRQLESGGPSAERGRQLIEQHGSVVLALKATHPDHGGSADDFADVQAAREEVPVAS